MKRGVYCCLIVCLFVGMRNAYRIFVRKPEEKRPRGRPRLRWEVKVRIDFKGNKMVLCGLVSCGSGFCDFGSERWDSVLKMWGIF
jgi:hypothetical protein